MSDLSTFTTVPTATLLEAAKAIENGHARTVIVVEDFDAFKVVGVLSEGDIIRALIGGADVRSPIGDYVRVDFTYFTERDEEKALRLFAEKGFGLIPVVDDHMRLQSVITMLDCVRRAMQ